MSGLVKFCIFFVAVSLVNSQYVDPVRQRFGNIQPHEHRPSGGYNVNVGGSNRERPHMGANVHHDTGHGWSLSGNSHSYDGGRHFSTGGGAGYKFSPSRNTDIGINADVQRHYNGKSSQNYGAEIRHRF